MIPIQDPYVTLRHRDGLWTPVLMAKPVGGSDHIVSDARDTTDDRSEAKRDAVSWSQELGVPFRRPE